MPKVFEESKLTLYVFIAFIDLRFGFSVSLYPFIRAVVDLFNMFISPISSPIFADKQHHVVMIT